jgi:hypothetical protein
MARRKKLLTPPVAEDLRFPGTVEDLYWRILNDYPFAAVVALAQSLAAYVDYYQRFPEEPKGGKHVHGADACPYCRRLGNGEPCTPSCGA